MSGKPDSADTSRTVDACPECGSTSIDRHGSQFLKGSGTAHYCQSCGNKFDEPISRSARADLPLPPGSLAAKLDSMDPDDVSTEGSP